MEAVACSTIKLENEINRLKFAVNSVNRVDKGHFRGVTESNNGVKTFPFDTQVLIQET